MVQKLKPFTEKDFSAGGNYDQEFSGEPIGKVGFRFAAGLTGAPATVRTDGTFRLLGVPEISQAEQPLIRMRGSSWRLLSAIQSGSFDNYQAPAAATPALASAVIDLNGLMPGAMVNGADKKVNFRGTFGATTDYSGTPPGSITGKLRGFVESSENDPTQGFWRPRFTENGWILAPSDLNQQVFKFEQDTAVVGIMVQAFDSSATDRVDGLIKRIRVDHVGDYGTQELHRATWGQLRALLCKRFTPEDAVRSVGCVFIPLIDKRNPSINNAVLFRAGDSLTINHDTTASVEEDLTAVVADGASDLAIATVIGFTRVAGTGDTQTAQQRVIGAAPASAPQSAFQRRLLQRAERVGAQ
jgi:hypothetical protein